ESIPTRNANISLRIMMDYLTEYENVNSPKSKKLISILKREWPQTEHQAEKGYHYLTTTSLILHQEV
ncbi:hypothetical protein cypCar_00035793, partial [Cyprinus carpio]